MHRDIADSQVRRIAAPMLRRGLGRVSVRDTSTGWIIGLLDRPNLSAFITARPDELEAMTETDFTHSMNAQCRAIIAEANARDEDPEPPRRL